MVMMVKGSDGASGYFMNDGGSGDSWFKDTRVCEDQIDQIIQAQEGYEGVIVLIAEIHIACRYQRCEKRIMSMNAKVEATAV